MKALAAVAATLESLAKAGDVDAAVELLPSLREEVGEVQRILDAELADVRSGAGGG